jgi:hypothetical protein
MATRIEPFTVVTPAATGVSAFLRTPLVFNDGDVTRLEIRIPPGPSGLVGFRIAHSGQSVIPATGNEWLIADNESLDWPLDGFPGNSGWELWSYNTDVYEHAIYLRFHVVDGGGFVPITITPIDVSQVAIAEVEPTDFVEVL